MKRIITISQKDKDEFKMINQSEKGFELIIRTKSKLNELLNIINSTDDSDIYINWQQKFKKENYTLYKKCIFSEPIDNFFISPRSKEKIAFGKKIKITCSGISYYTSNKLYINKQVKYSTHSYKDEKMLVRLLKISELKNIENESYI